MARRNTKVSKTLNKKRLNRNSKTSKKSPITAKSTLNPELSSFPLLQEPSVKYATKGRIRAIGNSKGVILPTSLMKASGIDKASEVIIHAKEGLIIIQPVETIEDINTDLSTWDAQFKKAIKKGNKPEADMFDGVENEFDQSEW